MQRIACFLLVIAFGFAPSTWAQPEPVRVRIKTGVSRVSLSGMNLRLVGHVNKFNKVAIPQTKQLQIARVSISGKGYWQIAEGGPASSQDVMSSEEALMIQGENLRQDATELPNKIVLQESADGQIDVIGVVPMEEYVFSVLASEMPLTWPMETLKAQAVAIRSYTEAILRDRQGRSFHVESSVLDQVYKKISRHENRALFEKAREAVRETEGIFLVKGPRVLKAFYHSDCGGQTVAAGSVWAQEKGNDAGVATDEGCPLNPMAQWRYRLPKARFVSLVKDFLGDIRSNSFRQVLGFMNLRSTNFKMRDQGEDVEFVGKGFGHGVGMCQWGSRALGLKKYSYQRILKHYYPLAGLKIISENN